MFLHTNEDGILERCRVSSRPCEYGGAVAQTLTRRKSGADYNASDLVPDLPIVSSGSSNRLDTIKDANRQLIDILGDEQRVLRSEDDFRDAYLALFNSEVGRSYFDFDEWHQDVDEYFLDLTDGRFNGESDLVYGFDPENFFKVTVHGKGYADFYLPGNVDGTEVEVLRGYVSPEELLSGEFLQYVDELISKNRYENLFNAGIIMQQAAERFYGVKPLQWVMLAREFSYRKEKLSNGL